MDGDLPLQWKISKFLPNYRQGNQMAETVKKPGNLGLVILEYLVEGKLGGGDVEGHASMETQISLTAAMQKTADRLWKEWVDKDVWNGLFSALPRDRKLLADLKPALARFYQYPTDRGFAVVLTEILQGQNHLTPEAVQRAVGDYITTLTEELIIADMKFRENARGGSDMRQLESLPQVEQQLPTSQPTLPPEEPLDNVILGQVEEVGYTESHAVLPPAEGPDIDMPHKVEESELQGGLNKLNKLPTRTIPMPGNLPKNSCFPEIHPDQLFVGRKEALRQLAVWLKKGDTVVINQAADVTGLGGFGKTRLASAFAQRYGKYFSGGVFWLNFAEPELIPSEVAACGGLAGVHSQDARVKQVLSDWQDGIPRLLIFDNCEDTHLLDQWRPAMGACRVLVTSRHTDWDPVLGIQILPLGLLERPDSLDLLTGLRDDLEADDPDLNVIAGDLEDMPLAVKLAGSFLNTLRKDLRPGEYLNALRQGEPPKPHMLRAGGYSPTGHDLDVERAFSITVDWMQKESEITRLALDLLKQIACFAPGEFIPLDLIRTSAEADKSDGTDFEAGVNRLLEMGLVENSTAGDLWIHSLVAWFVRDSLPTKAALSERVDQAVLSAAAQANQSGNPANMLPVLPHLKQLTDQALKGSHELAARLANELGYNLEAIADNSGARSYYQQALAFNQRMLGEAHPDTTVSLNNLGGLLTSIGDYKSARPYYEKALVIRRKVLGSDHPDTARSLNNMGHLLQMMEDYSGARPYYEQALAVRRKALGEEHSSTVISLNNLGGLLQAMGDYPGARSYYEQAMAVNRKVLGEEHPATAGSLNNLGGLFQAMSDYPAARSYFEQALAINRKVLGQNHPATATSLNNLGETLQAMGDYAGARSSFEQALAIRRKVFGEEHPDTAASLSDLGELLQAVGDYAAARPFSEKALSIRRKVLGEEHPDTIASLNNLGNLLLAQGDHVNAQSYLEQAQVIEQKVQAEKQSRTAAGFNILKYSMRVRVALIALFLLSFGVIGWQALAHQGVTSTALYGLVPTPNGTSNFQLSDLFPGLVGPSARTASPSRTATPTLTATLTSTASKTPTITKTPTATMHYGGIGPINTLIPTRTPFATSTRVPPSAIPPTPIPPTPVPPTNSAPTATATSPLPTVATPPTDTPSGPTDTPLPPPSDTPLPPPTSTTGPTVAPTP
jgi:tetratricopeptide (TPR) repeat protein